MRKQPRTVEIFSAGCPICNKAVQMIETMACSSCEVNVLNVHDPAVAERARALAIRSLPAVVVDGQRAACCAGRGVSKNVLHAAGVGRPL